MIASIDLGLSFLRGVVATVNPCAFVLLPTYLLFFLGVEAAEGQQDQRASVRRALTVGASVAAGFMVVFVAVGAVAAVVQHWLIETSKYVTLALGVAFVLLGLAMLFGYRPRFATPHVRVGTSAGRDRTVRSMVLYGAAYGTASLGCTMPFFLATVFGTTRADAIATRIANVGAYSVGMALVVVALTVSLAVANQSLLRVMRSVMRHVDLLAAAFMVVAGAYLMYYFFVVDIGGRQDMVTRAGERFQARVTTQLSDHWRITMVVLAAVVVAALVYSARRPRPSRSSLMADDAPR